MPPKAHPNDWDRYFRPNAPRRGGPLRALANLLLIGAAIGLLGGGAFFALRFGLERAQQAASQTAEQIVVSNTQVSATLTARTATAAAVAAVPPTATPAPPPVQPIGQSSVVAGGNLRSEPRLADETVIGQICAGDQLDLLEQSTAADGALWYRVRVTRAGANCSPQRVTVGSIGWASSTLLAPPSP